MLIFFINLASKQQTISQEDDSVLDAALVFCLLSQESAIVHRDLTVLVSITFFSLYISIIVHKPANNVLLRAQPKMSNFLFSSWYFGTSL